MASNNSRTNSRANYSNEIHDLSTVQNGTMPTMYYGEKAIADFFPPHLLKKVVSEVVATFLLVFMTCGAAGISGSDLSRISQLGQSIAGGLIVTVMIYAVGHISGAHMNPAVTLAFAVFRHFPWIQGTSAAAASRRQESDRGRGFFVATARKASRDKSIAIQYRRTGRDARIHVPFYWAAQFTGAICASFVLKAVIHPVDVIGTTTPVGPHWHSLVVEVIVTFNMMFVTLAVATDTRAVGELAGLAVGSAVCITSIFAGAISGGSMNPARTLGPALASNKFDGLWIYFLGPVMGTLSGAWTYTFIRFEDTPKEGSSQKLSSFKLRRLRSQQSIAADDVDEMENIQDQTRALDMIRNDPELMGLNLIQAPLVDMEIRGVPALKFLGDICFAMQTLVAASISMDRARMQLCNLADAQSHLRSKIASATSAIKSVFGQEVQQQDAEQRTTILLEYDE
ncbi:hypothetical protein OsI_08920 [Oryza sativa Indica Group]|uniref:Uncharacterized protein n=1 Tax=Oryza sativa subsp. indica TaxID=39946 RepID=B8AIG2_ORYSI|nr:hypothetical protein OsI_08920 [Oryza sativa Indica Group]